MNFFVRCFEFYFNKNWWLHYFNNSFTCIPHGMVQVCENHAKLVDTSWANDFHTFCKVQWTVSNSYLAMPETESFKVKIEILLLPLIFKCFESLPWKIGQPIRAELDYKSVALLNAYDPELFGRLDAVIRPINRHRMIHRSLLPSPIRSWFLWRSKPLSKPVPALSIRNVWIFIDNSVQIARESLISEYFRLILT